MACSDCHTLHPSDNCPQELKFNLDGTYLVPSIGKYPLSPLDLRPIVEEAETSTQLQLDVANRNLIFNNENSTKGNGSPDTVSISDMIGLTRLVELQDVEYPFATEGDLLSFQDGLWKSYTIPSGEIVTQTGVDAEGNLVKQGSATDPVAPDTVPLGAIITWPGDEGDLPGSYLRCKGQAISRTVYADLFALIGTRYGSGDGSTSFNLPNTSTRAIHGLSDSDTQFDVIGKTGGSKTHTLTTAQMPSHNHASGSLSTSTSGSHTHNLRGSNFEQTVSGGTVKWSPSTDTRSGGVLSGGAHSHNISGTTGNRGGSSSFNILGPYITMIHAMRVL